MGGNLDRRGGGPAGRGWGNKRGLVDLDGFGSGKGRGSGVTEETLSVTRERTMATRRYNRLGVLRATVGNNDMVVELKKAYICA